MFKLKKKLNTAILSALFISFGLGVESLRVAINTFRAMGADWPGAVSAEIFDKFQLLLPISISSLTLAEISLGAAWLEVVVLTKVGGKTAQNRLMIIRVREAKRTINISTPRRFAPRCARSA